MCLASRPAAPPPPPLPPVPAAPQPPPPPPTPVSVGERVSTIRGAASTRTRAREAATGTSRLRMPQLSVTPTAQTPAGGSTTGLNIPK